MKLGTRGAGSSRVELPDPGRYRAVAELAEELGYDSLWAGEHLSFHNPILDLGVALGAFAAVTRRITLGAGVVLLPLRHPSLVAKQAASLDYLSAGRLVLGPRRRRRGLGRLRGGGSSRGGARRTCG